MSFAGNRGMSSAANWVAAMVLSSLVAVPVKADLSGSIVGWVRDERGSPQMGASVSILTAEGVLAKRVFTDYSGEFSADGLLPGAYAVKVALGRFLPLTRDNVKV